MKTSFQTGKLLQHNADQFFDRFFEKYGDQLACAKGCDGCCHSSFGVHTWEAFLIIEWFDSLSDEEKKTLKNQWMEKQSKGKDAEGQEAMPCSFLYNGSCSIYPARPVICRTQGLALHIEGQLDSCPLNFSKEQLSTLPKEDWLELDRLNVLSILAQGQFEQSEREEFLLRERIELKDLKEFLSHR